MASWYVPLPPAMIEGVDTQKSDFEREGWWAYQSGDWSEHGHISYYAFAWLVKTPLGLMVLALVGATGLLIHRDGNPNLLLLLGSSTVLFVVVSAHTQMNEHYRYVIPSLPSVFILIGTAMVRWTSPLFVLAKHALLCWSLLSISIAFPNWNSYFNEAIGGGEEGYRQVLGSSIDWGQELPKLRQWQEKFGGDGPVHFALFTPVLGDEVTRLNAASVEYAWIGWPETAKRLPYQKTLTPGTYVVSVSHLMFPLSPYSKFQDFEPVERIGNTHFVFELEETIDAP